MTTADDLDTLDKSLLAEIQRGLPVEHRPFHAISLKLGLGEQQCLDRLLRLKQLGVFKQITAQFDGYALGYERAWIALHVPADAVGPGVVALQTYPGTAHVCERLGDFNIWASVWIPPHETLNRLVQIFQDMTKAKEGILLPAMRVYKCAAPMAGQELHPSFEESYESESHRGQSGRLGLADDDRRRICLLQEDLPLLEMPYAVWAEHLDCPEDDLFDWMGRMQRAGYLRRFHALGETYPALVKTALVAWEVPEGVVDDAGTHCARLREILHAARRPVYRNWPYSLTTLLHADSAVAAEGARRRVETVIGRFPNASFPLERDFGIRRVVFCTEAFDAWRPIAQHHS